MRIPGTSLLLRVLRARVAERRAPDFVIGGTTDPYLRRWWVLPRNRYFNVYLHRFMRSDDDRALHDHPWWNVSLLLDGRYREHTPDGVFLREPGHLYWRRAETAHRVELLRLPFGLMKVLAEAPVWTLFITGPRIREWGFLCPRGWRHWKEFCSTTEGGKNDGGVGRGCD